MIKRQKHLSLVKSFNDKNIKFFALGGLGEVGKNMYVIECDDEIIIIDCGILFPGSSFGVDYVIPDYTYLVDNQEKSLGFLSPTVMKIILAEFLFIKKSKNPCNLCFWLSSGFNQE